MRGSQRSLLSDERSPRPVNLEMNPENVHPVGSHYLLELFDCPTEKINDERFVRSCLVEAIGLARLSLVEMVSHSFHPHGLTMVVLLKESHLSFHSWPEYGYVAIDLFTCGLNSEPEAACDYLARVLEASRFDRQKIRRGPLES